MIKYGLNTIFFVFPIGFDSARRKISLLLKNNGLNICYIDKSTIDVNFCSEYMPQILKNQHFQILVKCKYYKFYVKI